MPDDTNLTFEANLIYQRRLMKPGWYWYRAEPTDPDGWVVTWVDADGWVTNSSEFIDQLPGEWRGPITQPEDWALAR